MITIQSCADGRARLAHPLQNRPKRDASGDSGQRRQGIEADCGGLMTCGTCHVYVREPHASLLARAGTDELGKLEFTAAPRSPTADFPADRLTEVLDGLTVDLPDSQH